jgi:hypothetical protein
MLGVAIDWLVKMGENLCGAERFLRPSTENDISGKNGIYFRFFYTTWSERAL